MIQKLKNEKGFTIIEVLIVLAIAGLIMVVVFLAVPALQRNSRNTQRTNDAARIGAAMSECSSNNNGNISLCDDATELANYITLANNQQLTTVGTAGLNAVAITASTQCNAGGTGTTAGGGTRAYTVNFQLETSGGTQNRCINV